MKIRAINTIFQRSLWACLLVSSFSFGQHVKASMDTTSIRIGEKLLYTLTVQVDSSELVVFPEGQTFAPLEVISRSKTDTVRKQAIVELITTYGLTQFDSGVYTIPRQPVQIGDEIHFSDSLKVQVNTVQVDTTKQGLYDIKPIIDVSKTSDWTWLLYLLFTALLGVFVWAALVFLKQRKAREDPMDQLEPFERAKQSLLSIAEASADDQETIKKYYSHLTFVLKSFLESKVYDHALESTTEELIGRLRLIRDGGQLNISDTVLDNITRVLQRSDLVKFAKSLPEKDLLRMDWQTFDVAISQINDGIPEPTAEELARDLAYQQEQQRLKKLRRRRMILSALATLPFLAFAVFMLVKSPKYAWDTVTFDRNKRLLETSDWVTSEYGFPGITITTPLVLQRISNPSDQNVEAGQRISEFIMLDSDELPLVEVKSTHVIDTTQVKLDVLKKLDSQFVDWENQEVKNIFEKRLPFKTPNGAEGFKVFGTAEWHTGEKVAFNLFYFISGKTTLQELIMVWPEDDIYAEQISDSIVGSMELLKKEKKEDE